MNYKALVILWLQTEQVHCRSAGLRQTGTSFEMRANSSLSSLPQAQAGNHAGMSGLSPDMSKERALGRLATETTQARQAGRGGTSLRELKTAGSPGSLSQYCFRIQKGSHLRLVWTTGDQPERSGARNSPLHCPPRPGRALRRRGSAPSAKAKQKSG